MRACTLRLIHRLLGVALVVGLTSTSVFAAGTAVVTSTVIGNVTKYTIAWTSDASGNVNTNPFSVIRGYLQQLKILPGTAGVQPTNLYGVKLADVDALDVLNALGLSQSNVTPLLLVFANSGIFNDATQTYDLVITGAGNAKQGTVTLWVR